MGLSVVGAAVAPVAFAEGLSKDETHLKGTIRGLKADVDKPVTVVILGAGSRGST